MTNRVMKKHFYYSYRKERVFYLKYRRSVTFIPYVLVGANQPLNTNHPQIVLTMV
jgi:hypothetical protein